MRYLVSLALGLALALGASAQPTAPLPRQPRDVTWPAEAWPTAKPQLVGDAPALTTVLDRLFESEGRGGLRDTRALVVIQGGLLVAERYAPGFDETSRFHSWSMAKSVTQALVGILVRDGRLTVDERAPVEEWAPDDDPRQALTLRHLLHMTTGLDNADGGDTDDAFVGHLLFGEGTAEIAALAAAQPLVHDPGTRWAYSTATSAILGRIVTETAGPGRDATQAWIRREFLAPLGMEMILEFDASGHLVGGSHAWATARDWARMGLLYLRDGIWDGREILPRGWVDFSRTPAPAENNGTFGAHLWLNREPGPEQFPTPFPGLPESVFMASGNAGQYVVAVPSKDLVVVRLGEMLGTDWARLGRDLAAVMLQFPDRPVESEVSDETADTGGARP